MDCSSPTFFKENGIRFDSFFFRNEYFLLSKYLLQSTQEGFVNSEGATLAATPN